MVFFGIHFSINFKARKDRIVPNYFSVYKFYLVPTANNWLFLSIMVDAKVRCLFLSVGT